MKWGSRRGRASRGFGSRNSRRVVLGGHELVLKLLMVRLKVRFCDVVRVAMVAAAGAEVHARRKTKEVEALVGQCVALRPAIAIVSTG